jgi:GST-like protein
MIDLYAYPSSNGQRAAVMLEECGLPYRVHRIDLAKGEQRDPAFLAINPAGQIPVIVDSDGPGGAPITVTQSGAILLYLAAKTGRLMPAEAVQRVRAVEQVFHAFTDCAGASGSIYALSARVPDKSEANVRFYEDRLLAHLRVADGALARQPYLAGNAFTIADVALYPIVAVRRALVERAGDLAKLMDWAKRVGDREAVARGMKAAG